MINPEQIKEILVQYKKHGWNLRRVLLLPETREKLNGLLTEIFGDKEIVTGEIDAVWFTRESKSGREAWELRHLSETPFALFETFEYDLSEDSRSEKISEMETRLKNQTSKR